MDDETKFELTDDERAEFARELRDGLFNTAEKEDPLRDIFSRALEQKYGQDERDREFIDSLVKDVRGDEE